MASRVEIALRSARETLADVATLRVEKTIWSSPAGKKRIAQKLANMLPPHKTYVEPFCGSAAVFFAKEPADVEVLNDADGEIAKAYRMIQRLTADKIKRLGKLKWDGSRAVFDRLKKEHPSGDVQKLYRFLYLTHFAYGKMRGKSYSPSLEGVPSRTVARIEQMLPRLKKARVFGTDYERIVRRYDGKDTAFFLDPPYAGYDVAVGEKTFDEERFFKLLKSLKGRWLVTYGVRGKLPKLLKDAGYHTQQIRTRRSIRAMRGVGGPSVLTQLIITNYKIAKRDEDGSVEDGSPTPPAPIRKNAPEQGTPAPPAPPAPAAPTVPTAGCSGAVEPSAPQQTAPTPSAPEQSTSERSEPESPAPDTTPPAPPERFCSVGLVKGVDPNDERYVLGVALAPETEDSQGDVYSADEVRTAAHGFMERGGDLFFMHKRPLSSTEVKVIETYLAPVDFEIGGRTVKKGTWLIALRVLSDELWGAIRAGELTGLSIAGSARTEPAAEKPPREQAA